MKIDHDSKIPLYYQLKEELKKKILEGSFKEYRFVPGCNIRNFLILPLNSLALDNYYFQQLSEYLI